MQELERKQDSQRDAVAQKGVQENQAELFRDPDSPIGGNPNGDVVIVEFNDYQCPYCKRAHQAVKSVVAADGKVKTDLQGPADPGRGLEDRRPRRAGLGQAGQAPRRCTTR